MPRFPVKDLTQKLTGAPVSHDDLKKAVSDAAKIVNEALNDEGRHNAFRQPAFELVLSELLAFESE